MLRHKPACRAGLHGIKAAVFMEYGYEGNLIALKEAKSAINIDKTCAEWSFLKGKCMGMYENSPLFQRLMCIQLWLSSENCLNSKLNKLIQNFILCVFLMIAVQMIWFSVLNADDNIFSLIYVCKYLAINPKILIFLQNVTYTFTIPLKMEFIKLHLKK